LRRPPIEVIHGIRVKPVWRVFHQSTESDDVMVKGGMVHVIEKSSGLAYVGVDESI